MKRIRREERSLCADLLSLCWRDSRGIQKRDFGSLEDISPHGACFQVEDPVPPGTLLTIICPGGKLRGSVKYCKFEQNGYFVGVEFAPGYRWTRQQYDPPHLLRIPSFSEAEAEA